MNMSQKLSTNFSKNENENVKKRASNFSKNEVAKLVKLVLQKKHIFHNKKTDAISSKLKDEAWHELATKFNASSFEEVRNAKILREKYNNIKRCIRKEKANKQKELLCDSPLSKEWIGNDSLLDELSDALSISVDGLQSRNDASETTAYEHIDNRTELKEEMIINDYFDENVEEGAEEGAEEASIDCDVSSAIFVDIGIRTDDELKNSPNNCAEYHYASPNSQRPDLLNTSKTKQIKSRDNYEITILKREILEQQFNQTRLEHEQKIKHARLEHEQRMLHSAEEHRIKIKILEAELELKSNNINKNSN